MPPPETCFSSIFQRPSLGPTPSIEAGSTFLAMRVFPPPGSGSGPGVALRAAKFVFPTTGIPDQSLNVSLRDRGVRVPRQVWTHPNPPGCRPRRPPPEASFHHRYDNISQFTHFQHISAESMHQKQRATPIPSCIRHSGPTRARMCPV